MEYRSKVQEALGYIERNLDAKISLDDLAQRAHLSKFHYHRVFRKIVGDSVAQYISKRRMESASEELVRTDRPILDIALKYQYGSQEAFLRAFKRVYGVTPGKYRKLHADGNRRVLALAGARFKPSRSTLRMAA